MKKFLICLLLFLIPSVCYAQFRRGGFLPDRSLTETVDAVSYSISKTHLGSATSGDTTAIYTVPQGSLIKYLIIDANAPSATAGISTLNLAIGSAGNADGDLGDATDIDFLVASGAHSSRNIHGDLTANYDGTKFATTKKSESHYVSADTTLYLNYLITGSTASTTTATGKVYIIYDYIP